MRSGSIRLQIRERVLIGITHPEIVQHLEIHKCTYSIIYSVRSPQVPFLIENKGSGKIDRQRCAIGIFHQRGWPKLHIIAKIEHVTTSEIVVYLLKGNILAEFIVIVIDKPRRRKT